MKSKEAIIEAMSHVEKIEYFPIYITEVLIDIRDQLTRITYAMEEARRENS